MCELENCVADAFFDINFALGGPLHLLNNIWVNLEPFEPLLGNGVVDGLQILADFLMDCHKRNPPPFYNISYLQQEWKQKQK
jgi:hypothetical protein